MTDTTPTPAPSADLDTPSASRIETRDFIRLVEAVMEAIEEALWKDPDLDIPEALVQAWQCTIDEGEVPDQILTKIPNPDIDTTDTTAGQPSSWERDQRESEGKVWDPTAGKWLDPDTTDDDRYHGPQDHASRGIDPLPNTDTTKD